jgi:hypothetical protein
MVFEKCRCYRVVSSPFIIPCPKPCKWPDQVFFFSLSLYGGKVGGKWGVKGNRDRYGTWKRNPLTLETKSPTSRLDRPLKIRRASHTNPFTHSLSHSTRTMAGRPAEVGRHSHEPPLHLQTGFCNTWHNSQAHTLSLYTHASVRGSAQ